MVSYRLGFDIGGTFTDLIAIEETTGNLAVVKCSTTPADPSIGVVTGLKSLFERLAISGAELSLAVHSTTLVTNTVLERKGARTALITTKGFRDVLEIGREKRITIYDIFEEKLAPVVPRHLRFEVDERTLYDGKIERKLDQRKVTNLVGKIKRGGIQSIAV